MSESRLGRKKSESHAAAISAALKGRLLGDREKILAAARSRIWTDEDKERSRFWAARAREILFKAKPETNLERSVRLQLESLGVKLSRSVRFGVYVADLYVPSIRMVIECDGEFWHDTEECRAKDKRRDEWFRSSGYQVVRLAERVIIDREELCRVMEANLMSSCS